jgi:hypothetical protein
MDKNMIVQMHSENAGHKPETERQIDSILLH